MSAPPTRLNSDFSPLEIFTPLTPTHRTFDQIWDEFVATLSNHPPTTLPESSSSSSTSHEHSPDTTPQPSFLDPPTLTSIQSSYITPSVHQHLLSHFSTLPSAATADYLFFEKDRFYTLYVYEYCRGPGPYGEASTYPPPCFRQIIEEGMLFYVRVLYPYFASLGKGIVTRSMWLGSGDPRKRYFELFLYFGSRDVETVVERGTIRKRWRHRLMREGQVVLLEMVIRKLFIQIEALLGLDDVVVGEEAKMEEMERMVVRTDHFIRRFLGSERFRSERLEVLLLRHIAEEDINWEVVRGVDTAQRVVETKYPDWSERGVEDYETSEEDDESSQGTGPASGYEDELDDGSDVEALDI